MKRLLFFSFFKSLILWLLLKHLSFLGLYGLNLILTLLAARFLFLKRDENQQRPLFILLEIITPFFSTLALIIYALSGLLLRRIGKVDDDFDHRLPFGEEHYQRFLETRNDELVVENFQDTGEEGLHDSFQIEPFLDIIEGNDIDLKINAIGKLSAVPAKSSIALLKLALGDASYEVKYFASNSLSLLERQLIGKIEVLGQAINRFPENFGNYTQRGLTYLNMYYLGIIDPGVAEVFLERALNDFLYSLQIDSRQNYLYVKILEIHTYRGEHEQILELQPLLTDGDFPEEDLVKIRFYIAEALYRMGRYEELADCLEAIKGSTQLASLMVEPISYWTRESA